MKPCSFFSRTVYCTWDSFSFRGVKKLNFIWRKKMNPSLLLLYHLSSCLVFLGNSVQQMNAFIRKFSKLIQFCIAIYFGSANTRPLHCFLWFKSLYAPILFCFFVFTSVSWLYSRDPNIYHFNWQKSYWRAVSIIYFKGHESMTLFWTSNLSSENVS